MKRTHLLAVTSLIILSSALNASIVTYFNATDIADDGTGIFASATATITAGPGYLDIVLENTSPLGPMIGEEYANPLITELEFKYLTGFTLDKANSYVSSFSDTLFSQGSGVAATNLSQRNLRYDFFPADTPGMDGCFMSLDLNNVQNDNTIGSLNMLDGLDVPLEGYASGFLNPEASGDRGTIFNKALFHFAFNETAIPDVNYYATNSTLVTKFIGGGDYSYKHAANVPEPATMVLLGLGAMVLRKRK